MSGGRVGEQIKACPPRTERSHDRSVSRRAAEPLILLGKSGDLRVDGLVAWRSRSRRVFQ